MRPLHLRPRLVALLGVLACSLPVAAQAQTPTPVGSWRTIDDATGEAKSIVRIVETAGELRGTVTTVFAPPAPTDNPLCEKCPGDRRNTPVVGMEILWGLRRQGDEYTGGRVLDPENGNTYRCTLRVIDGGRKLELRGYVGMRLFGRTQTWVRE